MICLMKCVQFILKRTNDPLPGEILPNSCNLQDTGVKKLQLSSDEGNSYKTNFIKKRT